MYVGVYVIACLYFRVCVVHSCVLIRIFYKQCNYSFHGMAVICSGLVNYGFKQSVHMIRQCLIHCHEQKIPKRFYVMKILVL